jgi:hypothetical protein
MSLYHREIQNFVKIYICGVLINKQSSDTFYSYYALSGILYTEFDQRKERESDPLRIHFRYIECVMSNL